jgi:hypothetical protein
MDEESRLRWNLAADAKINDDLLAADVELPHSTPHAQNACRQGGGEFYYIRMADPPEISSGVPNCRSGGHGQDECDGGESVLSLPE